MILGVPLYAVVKTIIEFIYNLVQLQHEQRTKSQSEQPK